jgi:glycosyltransferase involved in cell wall biosynthesis
MRSWFTCTPESFDGGPGFFARDSGLICRGLQQLGIDCHALMPFGEQMGDEPDLQRTDYRNLESADWWKSQGDIEGVVLYSWASPSHRRVAAAIREAGIFLVVNLDNSGLVSPLVGLRRWLAEQWILSGKGKGRQAWQRFFFLVAKGMTFGLVYTDPLRSFHLKQADVIACVSPLATSRITKLCTIYGGQRMAEKVRMIPHAVQSQFCYGGEVKMRRIVCVGRWNDFVQKRTPLLCETMQHVLAADPQVSVVIIGQPVDVLIEWHQHLDDSMRQRVDLAGAIPRSEIARLMQKSQVFYSASAFESFGIAAAEALCCGCSVVAESSVSMAAFDWFVSEASGTLTQCSSGRHHADALCQEIRKWDQGERDGRRISSIWSERLHEHKVAAEILTLFQEARA